MKPYRNLLGLDKDNKSKWAFVNKDKTAYFAVKRFLDLLISITAFLLLFPFLILIALVIKLTSKGPAFYAQERVGRFGKIFILYKFRSMVADAEKHTGPVWAKHNDDRVTLTGRILRRTRLDELPQIWNVIKGDMSIVGPRPERPFFVKQHKELQGERLSVNPGLTGLAQVEGNYHFKPHEKWFFDEFYIRHRSIALDIIIILKTLWIIVSKKGS
ncbi:MAG: hypothetical protein A2452_02560 [Candidatus Firestonebacteria bacterium RIFOXYC2_FULL_39_67]|nr:MAG: hypothetical protein A2536_06895 [Candidatus Firestonebacteria bacterium RIFOXYD2_FULL_39_29]OGF54016.1 MAG: hypothetical protein A2452_02560 [Candidatus Firestonebacteria bacterium RIFOXYC2_FULL_39_67]OGF57167.1 MAG: hypothetical protein A2497_02310 [Candidatus Firestonebacteria bacterium RifOxyC12_full_39_7]